jgi:hypothetical protein
MPTAHAPKVLALLVAGLVVTGLASCRSTPKEPESEPFVAPVPTRISSFPGVSSYHTTYTLFPDEAIAGKAEIPALLLRLIVPPNVAPPSVDLL